MHLLESDVEELAAIYKQKYNQDLIGTNLTQFHCDFDRWDGAVGDVHSKLLIALGKKSYIDVLVDEEGNESYHSRLKGIPHAVMDTWCYRNNKTLQQMYEHLLSGEPIPFNILDGSKGFRKNKYYQQVNMDKFVRVVRFNGA